jgi:hypothetical protein
MRDVRRIRRQLSRRLEKALREGRLTQEREAIEREAESVSRQTANGRPRNHRAKK